MYWGPLSSKKYHYCQEVGFGVGALSARGQMLGLGFRGLGNSVSGFGI